MKRCWRKSGCVLLFALVVSATGCGDETSGDEGDDSSECSLSCNATSATYSCASNSAHVTNEYCGAGSSLRSQRREFDNGHVLTCTFDCAGGGSCEDDTGETCSF